MSPCNICGECVGSSRTRWATFPSRWHQAASNPSLIVSFQLCPAEALTFKATRRRSRSATSSSSTAPRSSRNPPPSCSSTSTIRSVRRPCSVRISWRCLSRERFRDYRKRTFRSFLLAFSTHFDLCDCALKSVVRKEQLQ